MERRLYGGQLDMEAVPPQDLQEGIIGGGHILPGSIDLDLFAETIIPPRVLDALPALPDAEYPEGTLAFLTTDGKLYRNVADVWDSSVDGGDIIEDSIVAGSIAAGAIGTEQLAADAVIANVVNVSGSVVIDDDGIVIADEFGQTGLTAQGFAGSWLSFLFSGLYNNQFAYGANGPLTQGDTTQIPYWAWSSVTHLGIVEVEKIAAPSAPGDAVISISANTTTPGEITYAGMNHLPGTVGVRVQAGRPVTCRVAWRAVGAGLSDPQRIRFALSWYDKDASLVGTTTVDTPDRITTGAAGVYLWDQAAPVTAPGDAAYVQLVVAGMWNLGVVDTSDSIEIAEVALEVGGNQFESIAFGDVLTFQRLAQSDTTLEMVSDSGDAMFRIVGAGGGNVANGVMIDGDSMNRVEIGVLTGTPYLSFSDGSAEEVHISQDAANRLSFTTGYMRIANAGQAALALAPEGWIQFERQGSAVPVPPASSARLYLRDNAGNDELAVRFANGTTKAIADDT